MKSLLDFFITLIVVLILSFLIQIVVCDFYYIDYLRALDIAIFIYISGIIFRLTGRNVKDEEKE
jgi:hypothetical protein